MFDIGFFELAICAIVALIVFGPERLPEVARQCGRFVGRARSYVRSVTQELERELQPGPFQQHLKDTAIAIEKEAVKLKSSIDSI